MLVLKKLLVTTDGDRPKLIIVPLVGNLFDSFATEQIDVLLCAILANKAAMPEQEVGRRSLAREANLSEAVDAVLVIRLR